MRLCFICNSNSIHSQRWIRYFARRGHEVHVITISPPRPLEIEGVILHPIQRRVKAKGISKIFNYIKVTFQTYIHIKSIKPDILNVLFLTDYGFYGALSRFHPYVVTPWGSDILRHPFQKKFWLFSNKFSLKSSDLILCNSFPMHQVLVEKLEVSEKKIIDITWNGVDRTIFNSHNCDSLREKLKLKNKVVLFSNRNLESLYNIECILRMFADFNRQVRESALLIAGDGTQREVLLKLCELLKLKESVIFLGRISPYLMSDYFNIADIYITVPQSDSCSGSLLEAFACEKTVIASDIPANKVWIENSRNGWLVKPENKEKFTNTCLNAIKHPLQDKEIKNNLRVIKNQADYNTNMLRVEKEFSRLVDLIHVH
jgi:glycosyltransferase involved in cell wall biosynthesis